MMVADAPLSLPESSRRLSRFRVEDWYLGQSGLVCDRWTEDLVEVQLLRRKVSIRGANMAVVLATYAQLVNNVVDQVFDWAEKGPSASVGDLNQLLESLTRRQLGDRWEKTFLEFRHQGAEYQRQYEARWGAAATVSGGQEGAAAGSGTVVEQGSSSRTPAGATAAQPAYPEATQERDWPQREKWSAQDQESRGYASGTGQGHGYSPGAGANYGPQYVPSSRNYYYGVGDRRPAELEADEEEPAPQRP